MIPLTRDSIALQGTGVVNITQPKKGFRFTLDSLLLADFCRIKHRDRVLEPGAGTGVISLLLAKKFPQARFTADEIEPHAFGLLRRNIEQNDLSDRVAFIDRDVKDLCRMLAPDSFDVIVANPPYLRSGTGRTSPLPGRRTAHQDQAAALPVWLNLQKLLKNKGRYVLVFPAQRAAELMVLLRERTLEPKRLRFVHPFTNKPASLCLIEAVKSAGVGLEILPPLVVHDDDRGYTEEMKNIYGLNGAGITP